MKSCFVLILLPLLLCQAASCLRGFHYASKRFGEAKAWCALKAHRFSKKGKHGKGLNNAHSGRMQSTKTHDQSPQVCMHGGHVFVQSKEAALSRSASGKCVEGTSSIMRLQQPRTGDSIAEGRNSSENPSVGRSNPTTDYRGSLHSRSTAPLQRSTAPRQRSSLAGPTALQTSSLGGQSMEGASLEALVRPKDEYEYIKSLDAKNVAFPVLIVTNNRVDVYFVKKGSAPSDYEFETPELLEDEPDEYIASEVLTEFYETETKNYYYACKFHGKESPRIWKMISPELVSEGYEYFVFPKSHSSNMELLGDRKHSLATLKECTFYFPVPVGAHRRVENAIVAESKKREKMAALKVEVEATRVLAAEAMRKSMANDAKRHKSAESLRAIEKERKEIAAEIQKAADAVEIQKAADAAEIQKAADAVERRKRADAVEIQKAADAVERRKAADAVERRKRADAVERWKRAERQMKVEAAERRKRAEAARRKQEEAAERRKQAEAAERRKQAEAAERRKQEEAAERRKQAEAAERQMKAEAAERRKKAEIAKKKRDEEIANIKSIRERSMHLRKPAVLSIVGREWII